MTLKPEQPSARQGTEAADADRVRMQERVTTIVMDILELDRDLQLLPDQRLDELGLDSLMSIELAEVLAEQFAVVLSPTFAMSHPTVHLMTELLLAEVSATPES